MKNKLLFHLKLEEHIVVIYYLFVSNECTSCVLNGVWSFDWIDLGVFYTEITSLAPLDYHFGPCSLRSLADNNNNNNNKLIKHSFSSQQMKLNKRFEPIVIVISVKKIISLERHDGKCVSQLDCTENILFANVKWRMYR